MLLANEGERVILEVVYDGSPAANAGLKPGDVVQSIGGRAVHSARDFSHAFRCFAVGEQVPIVVLRGEEVMQTQAALVERPNDPMPPAQKRHDTSSRPFLGVTLMDLTPGLSEKLSADSGVVIAEVFPKSPAAIAGLQSGDVLVEVGDHKVTSQADVGKCMSVMKPGDVTRVSISRQGQIFQQSLTLDRRPAEWVYFLHWLSRNVPGHPALYLEQPELLQVEEADAPATVEKLRQQLLAIERRLEYTDQKVATRAVVKLEGILEQLRQIEQSLDDSTTDEP